MTPRALIVSLAVLATPVAGAPGPSGGAALTAPPPGLNLTGRWELERDLSEAPGDEAREDARGLQTEPRRPRYPPIHPGEPPPRPGDRDDRQVPKGPGVDVTTPGMTGVPQSDPFRQGGSSGSTWPFGGQGRTAASYVEDLPETLTIAQRPELILIQEDDDEGRIRALVPDGVRRQSTDREYEHLSRWENGVLKVQTWHDDGRLHVEEVFELAPEKGLLTVSYRADDGGDPITVERVFRLCPRAES
jgi:hypothetical protein